MNLCVIPARGGSKRILRKNIKTFNGKPILAYSIIAAIQSDSFERVIVSTDNTEIAEIARQYGAETPFIRPKELSDDYTGTIPVIKHAIEWFDLHQSKPDYVCCIYATAPFITAQAIRESKSIMQKENADYCFTVTSFPFPIQRAVKIKNNKRLEMFYPEYFETRSQDLEEAFHDAGQLYWGVTDSFLLEKPIFSGFSVPYLLPRHLVQDIDTPEDWTRAELMHQVLEKLDDLK